MTHGETVRVERSARGGGVGLYIRSGIKYKLRNEIVNTNIDIEHSWLEVTSLSGSD